LGYNYTKAQESSTPLLSQSSNQAGVQSVNVKIVAAIKLIGPTHEKWLALSLTLYLVPTLF